MELRRMKRVDYKSVHRGASLRDKSYGKETTTWSTKRYFKLVVKDSRVVDGKQKLLVHYQGWDKKYDEWRLDSDILNTPAEAISGDALSYSAFQLTSSIKEKLVPLRKQNSEVTISIPVQKDIFTTFIENSSFESESRHGNYIYRFSNATVGEAAFAPNWWFRICNSAHDLCSHSF
ncbi:hypothetical protein HOLleu_42623 [Holothuria leucospilota]|uniref:Chromo domain-containing protein n=1 Tax=Holothuria leucospilota TaxID=206669 RepID=A0A9Q0YBH3_HOLLE|nr:hypothetical protein HOLleu_42623 [Holothuria leucospilota]